MSQGQVAGGYQDDDARSTGWLLIIGAAVVAALLSLAVHHASTGAAPTPPAPKAFTPPAVRASASAVPSASASAASASTSASAVASAADPTARILHQISGYVSVAQVCAPITDGKTTLTVRFLLRNATSLAEQLVSVTPELPMGGLKPKGAAVQGGTCIKPYGAPAAVAHDALPAGGSVVVLLDFALPKACPAPYPIQAVIKVAIAGAQRTDSVALYTDLGSVKFNVCK